MAKKRLARMRELKAKFDAAHEQGTDGLKAHDYSALTAAIEAERAILEEQSALINAEKAQIARLKKRRRKAKD